MIKQWLGVLGVKQHTEESDDIVENSQDTMTLLGKYIDDLDINLDKTKLKGDISKLYHEAQDLEL